MIAQWGEYTKDTGFFFHEITGIRQQAMNSRTIRKVFADRGIYPFNPALVIQRLNTARSPTPELHWPTGDTPPPQSSSIPSSPTKSAVQARRTQGKIPRIPDLVSIHLNTRRPINWLSHQVVQMAENISLLTPAIEHQLPPVRSKTRKSQKQVGKFGALTTKDAIPHIAKEKNHEPSVRNARRMAPPSLNSTPNLAVAEA